LNGKISGNTVSGRYDGGGVHVSSGTFTMSGGEISGNTASRGGGVYLYSNYTFSKYSSGGVIYGSNATEGLKNTATDGAGTGAAVYYDYSRKYRETTVTANESLSTSDTTAGWNQ
jgi:hypothetical protein